MTGATHIINACIRLGVERLVYTSSFATVVGPQQVEDVNAHSLSWNEDSFEHAMPNDLPAYYAKTKRMAELRLFTANGRGRLRTIALRPCVPFGPGDKLQTHRVAYEWFIAHTTDRSKVNVQSSFVYCKNWALWHKLAADVTQCFLLLFLLMGQTETPRDPWADRWQGVLYRQRRRRYNQDVCCLSPFINLLTSHCLVQILP